MTFAWQWAKQRAYSTRTFRPAQFFSEALKAAWANERCLMAYAAREAVSAASIRFEMNELENTDRLGSYGLHRLAVLGVQLHAAV